MKNQIEWDTFERCVLVRNLGNMHQYICIYKMNYTTTAKHIVKITVDATSSSVITLKMEGNSGFSCITNVHTVVVAYVISSLLSRVQMQDVALNSGSRIQRDWTALYSQTARDGWSLPWLVNKVVCIL